MTINHPHTAAKEAAYTQFKELSGSLDDWFFATEKQGVKLYSKQLESGGPIIVRGDYVVDQPTANIQQIMAVASSAGARKIWDDKFDCYELKEIYEGHDILFWAKVKTPWPVSPRDMCCIVSRIHKDKTEYAVMTSVEDDKVPDISGNVRAHLFISGWKVTQTASGIEVTYITQIDLKGSIPGAFLKNIQIQVPLCAGKVVDYVDQHGYPPFVLSASPSVRFEGEDFCHTSKSYTMTVNSGEGDVVFDISSKMYSNPTVELKGNDANTYTLEDGKCTLHVVSGPVTIEIK